MGSYDGFQGCLEGSGEGGRKRTAWIGSTTEVIRITDVEFTDTATILGFHERYKPGRGADCPRNVVRRELHYAETAESFKAHAERLKRGR